MAWVKFRRVKRVEIPGHARALTFSCFQNQPFLKSERACGWFVDAWTQAIRKHPCDVWAYCMMPTHVHLLLAPPKHEPGLSELLKSLKLSVTRKAIFWVRANAPWFLPRMRDREPDGRVVLRFWQRGSGYDRDIWSDRSVWKTVDYIHMNPVEEELCERSTDWKWSSAAYYATGVQGPIVVDTTRMPARPVRP